MNIRAEILSHPFELPKPGQKLADRSYYSSPAGKLAETFHEYAWTHKRAADVLAWAVESGQVPLAQVGAPLLNLYRHAIELAFKDCLELGRMALGDTGSVTATHSLKRLLELFQAQQYRLYPDVGGCAENAELNRAFRALVSELDSMDPVGATYRYPVDNRGRDWNTPNVAIEASRLRAGIDQIWNYLDCHRESVAQLLEPVS